MSQEEKHIGKKDYEKNLKRIIWETVLTSMGAGFSVATITVFWNSIGMDQKAIGFVQMVFTIVLCCLDVPMGYIADRFNRKVLNIIGDIGVAIVFAMYALSQNMYMVLISECFLGMFMAMTNGVDQSFIKFNCNKIDKSGNLFKKINVRVHTARYIALFSVTILGGIIAKYNIRFSIAASFIPYFIGGIIAFNIEDYNGKKEVNHKNPIKDMISTMKEIVKEKKVRTYMISYMLGKEITHAQIWVFTPLLMLVGVPIEIVSIGWTLNYFMQIIGSKLSEKMVNYKTSNKFVIPIMIEFAWISILLINTNIVTVWFFALNGFVHGLIEGNLMTSLQEVTQDEIQTSVMSLVSTGARLLYIPVVYIINYLGNIQLQFALVGVCIIFIPMCLANYVSLKKLENV